MKKTLLFLLALTLGITLYSQTAYRNLIWGDRSTQSLRAINLNQIPPYSAINFSGTSQNTPLGIAIDTLADKIYVADAGTHTIKKYNFDGTGGTTLLDSNSFTGLTHEPYGIILLNGEVWWSAATGIYKVKMTGANPMKVIDFGQGPPELPLALVYHEATQKLFVVNDKTTYNGGLYSMNLDGSNLTLVISSVEATAITLDTWNDLFYMAAKGGSATNFPTTSIYGVTLDGTVAFPIANQGLQPTTQIVYDQPNEWVYFGQKNSAAAADGKLVRCDWDGSNSVDLINNISPNGLALDKVRLTTGVDEKETVRLKVFPNPASDRLFINTKGIDEPNVRVYNLLGTEIARFDKVNEHLVLDVSGWNTGCYIVEIQNQQQKLQTRVNIVR